LFSDNSRNFGSCPASSAMRSCRVHTISDSVVPIVFPSNASLYRSVPSLRWLPPSSRFATFIGTMNGLRQPCNRRRRFVALSTPDSISAILCVPVSGLRQLVAAPSATKFLGMPAQLIPGFPDGELHGPHRFLYDPLPFRLGLRPRRCAADCPSSHAAFRPR